MIFSNLFRPNVEKLKASKNLKKLAKASQHRDISIARPAADALRELLVERYSRFLMLSRKVRGDNARLIDACKALGDFGGPIAVESLIRALNKDDFPYEVTKAAMGALIGLGTIAVQPLIQNLYGQMGGLSNTAWALAVIGDFAATEPLLRTLYEVRKWSCGTLPEEIERAIIKLGDPRTIELLRPDLAYAPNSYPRRIIEGIKANEKSSNTKI